MKEKRFELENENENENKLLGKVVAEMDKDMKIITNSRKPSKLIERLSKDDGVCTIAILKRDSK